MINFKEEIFGWKSRLVQIEDMKKFLKQQQEEITEIILELESAKKRGLAK